MGLGALTAFNLRSLAPKRYLTLRICDRTFGSAFLSIMSRSMAHV